MFFLSRGGGGSSGDMVRAKAAAAGARGARVPVGPTPRANDVLLDKDGNIVAAKIRNPRGDRAFKPKSTPQETAKAIADYKYANRYPSTSRPLRPEDRDLLEPNQRYEQPRPSRSDDSVQLLYSGPKNTIVGDEAISTFLHATKDGKPFALEILAAQARIQGADGGSEVALTYAPSGAGRYVNQFAPGQFAVSEAAYVKTEIWFEVGPGLEESRSLTFFYTPAEAVPARFTGDFRDAIENGSLVVYAGIEVSRPGHYVIDCNLHSIGGDPVMFSRYKGQLDAGRTEVRLLFFGKALRDVGVPPPYKIGQLRGGLHVPTADPDMQSMPLREWNYVTRSEFTLDGLSDAEYDSDHKQKMIELMGKYGTKTGSDSR